MVEKIPISSGHEARAACIDPESSFYICWTTDSKSFQRILPFPLVNFLFHTVSTLVKENRQPVFSHFGLSIRRQPHMVNVGPFHELQEFLLLLQGNGKRDYKKR
jgi:hypothetical protein